MNDHDCSTNSASAAMTPKERMLNAYRGIPSDYVPTAPEFWTYYPAKLLGMDMIEFEREMPMYRALKHAFTTFGCEGWGCVAENNTPPKTDITSQDRWIDNDTLETRTEFHTPYGRVSTAQRVSRHEPSWATEGMIKDLATDLAAWKHIALAAPEAMDCSGMVQAWEEVGDSYLLEAMLGVPFFDFYASGRQGGMEEAVMDFVEHPALMEQLQQEYRDYLVRKARVLCERTPFESFFIGCSWSCNSLIGPRMWRQWDKPVIEAVAGEIHQHNKLLHVHFHGRSRQTLADFAEIGIDCVCPFERPPGGDIAGLEGLQEAAEQLGERTTFNGNIHTVETLIRGTPDDVRREVREVVQAFGNSSRVIIGTGDQVGYETPEENLHTMIEESRALTRRP